MEEEGLRNPERGNQVPFEVKVVKGCPLIPKEVALGLLDEYGAMREKGELVALKRLTSHWASKRASTQLAGS